MHAWRRWRPSPRPCRRIPARHFQIGVQIFVNGISASLAVAKVCGGSFLRITALVGESDTQWGLVKADPQPFLAYREKLGAQDIKLIAEVEGMHFHWRGEPKPVGEIAKEVVALGAHAVEIAHPDEEINLKLIREIKAAVPGLPVILGGHTKHENAARRLAEADGAFVGTCFEDQWGGNILESRVREYMDIVRSLPTELNAEIIDQRRPYATGIFLSQGNARTTPGHPPDTGGNRRPDQSPGCPLCRGRSTRCC